jgi:hypothetical protein
VNPLLALLAHWLQMELPILLPLLESEAAGLVKSTLRQKWADARKHIVYIVNVHDGITLDPTRTFTGKDGRTWTHPAAFVRDVAFWLFHEFPIGGTGADFVRDLSTRGLIASVVPQITAETTPEQAYDLVVEYLIGRLPF